MLIGIDGNEANVKNKVGVHQMAYEILWELYKLEDKKKLGNSYKIYLKNQPGADLPKEKSFWKYEVLPGGKVWILTKLMPALFKDGKPDVFLTPSHYLPPLAPMPKVMIVTDLGYLKFTGQFRKYDYWQLKYWTAISLIVSKYIIAISESTRKDILSHYKFAENKVETILLGPNKTFTTKNLTPSFVRNVLKKYGIRKNYILFLSTLKPSKNIEGLLRAFADVRKKSDCQMVIAGKKGWMYESIFDLVKKLKLEKDVVFTDFLPEEEKPVLFAKARVFVTPSFWEGFGIDILNSFASGVPAVVSNVASIPEVAGKAGIYVDPENHKSISKGILKVLKMSPKEYNNQVKLGYAELQKFSWQKTAAGVLKVLNKAHPNK